MESKAGGGAEQLPVLPNRSHHSRYHSVSTKVSQPSALKPKSSETKEEAHLCKLHSHAAADGVSGGAIKHRQEEGKFIKSEERKQPPEGRKSWIGF